MAEVELIYELVSQNRLDEAIAKLKLLAQKKPHFNKQLLAVEQQFIALRDDEMMGVLSFEQKKVSRAQVTKQILSLAQGFAQNSLSVGDSPSIPPQLASESNQKTILFLAANPSDTSRLHLDKELRDIEEGLKLSPKGNQFKLVSKHAIRVADLQRALMEEEPTIVHFSGHGAMNGKLIIESVDGGNHYLNPSDVGELFELFADTVECVVLNACYSEEQADEIVKFIPFVVGMNQAISDKKAAIPFAVAFYDALGNGKSIEFAFKLGKNRIKLSGGSGAAIPVLKVK